jgi:HPt (histidine-containing phosphotransfer) domain-containing protein
MNPAQHPDSEPPGLAEALNRLWCQFLPQMFDRVAALEAAVAPLAAGTLSDPEREEANDAAHKLAGILGSFGVPEGTLLAREAETLCVCQTETAAAGAARLTEIVAELRALIENRK